MLQCDYPVPGSLSVWTIEKAGGRRAGSGRERGGDGRCSFFSIVQIDREPGTAYNAMCQLRECLLNTEKKNLVDVQPS